MDQPQPARQDDVRVIDLVVTARCNLSCAYCYQNDKKDRRMKWSTARRAVDLLLASRQPRVKINFYGGEPLLEFDLIRQVVDEARARAGAGKHFDFGIITNGTLMDEKAATFLAANRVSTQISFDGLEEAQVLRGKGTFQRLDAVLSCLRRDHAEFFRKRVSVSMVLTRTNLPYLGKSIAYFLRKGVQEIAIGPQLQHDPCWRPAHIEDLDEQFALVFETSLRHFRNTGEIPLLIFRRGREDGKTGRPGPRPMCGVGRGEALAVDVGGQVCGCVMFATSFQSVSGELLPDRLAAMAMGGLEQSDFGRKLAAYPAAARGAELFDDKQDKYSSYGRCGDCPHLGTCSVCPVSIGHIPGNTDPRRIPDFICAYNLVLHKYRLRFPRQPDPMFILKGERAVPHAMKKILRIADRLP